MVKLASSVRNLDWETWPIFLPGIFIEFFFIEFSANISPWSEHAAASHPRPQPPRPRQAGLHQASARPRCRVRRGQNHKENW